MGYASKFVDEHDHLLSIYSLKSANSDINHILIEDWTNFANNGAGDDKQAIMDLIAVYKSSGIETVRELASHSAEVTA